MLTLQDLLKIERTVGDKIKEKFDEKFHLLPTKQDFFSRMDKLSGELKSVRESFDLHAGQHGDINDRLDRHHKRLSTFERTNNLPVAVDD
ncbi:hypothetical protein MUP56_01920 [Patescibacteria group bacterium]|nr:hypothetical protein [Patescibacteria group bacterium]